MFVHSLAVKNFRGIKSLNWKPNGRLICLVGPNDSTKTTILDALEYCLSPQWNVPFTETDFYDADSGQGDIVIEATISGIPVTPDYLDIDRSFGARLRGVSADGTVHPEPEDGDAKALSVQLTVGADLEPKWVLLSASDEDGIRITAKDRMKLGVARLDADAERDLAWSRYSSLTKMTGDLGETDAVLAKAQRMLREAVKSSSLESLQEAARRVQEAAERLGVKPLSGYGAGLDAKQLSFRSGAFGLHDGAIPLRAAGLGTRRLVALAIQRAAVPSGAIVLADEIDLGLEPHRIRQLLRSLLSDTNPGKESGSATLGQVILTTHSAVPILELDWKHLRRVFQPTRGTTEVLEPAKDLCGLPRTAPNAFLSRRVLVCEGNTEFGLVRGLLDDWAGRHSGIPVAHHGVEIVNGQGTRHKEIVTGFAKLKYAVALLGDSDVIKPSSVKEMQDANVEVVLWDGSLCTEQRLSQDLPDDGIETILKVAVVSKEADSVRGAINAALGKNQGNSPADPASLPEWLRLDVPPEGFRKALGLAAKKNSWFKTSQAGYRLGATVAGCRSRMAGTDTIKKLDHLETWCYGG